MTVTVLNPAYNRTNKLEELSVSLYTQAYKDFEWLIVDDDSSDNAKGI